VQLLVTGSVLRGVVLTSPLCDMPAAIEALNRTHTKFVRIAPEKPLAGSFDVRIDDHKARMT